MFVFIKKMFYIGSLFLSSLVIATSLSCISMKNQKCKVRPEIINVNSNEPVFYPFSIKASKCSGSCSNINDPYVKISDWTNNCTMLITLSKYIFQAFKLTKVLNVVFLCFHFGGLFSIFKFAMVDLKFFFSNYFKDVF